MSTLAVIGYDDVFKAEEVRLSLIKMQRDYPLKTSLSHEDEAKLQAALSAGAATASTDAARVSTRPEATA